MMFTNKQLRAIASSLEIAAKQYREDARLCILAKQDRIGDGFLSQAAMAEAIATIINDEIG